MKLIAHFKEDAFAALYERLMPKLLAFAYRWCGDQQLAEDVVQEAFVKLWQKRADIQWDDSIDRLLYTMVRNRLINAYHQKLREQILATDLKRTDDDGHAEPNFEILLKIEQYIDELPPRCKEVFLMSKRDGLTYQEIAAELSLSIKSVEKHISKALKILRQRLGRAYFYFF